MRTPPNYNPQGYQPGNAGMGGLTDWISETFFTPAVDVAKDTLPAVQSGVQAGIREGLQTAISNAIGGEHAVPAGTTATSGNVLPQTAPPASSGIPVWGWYAIGAAVLGGVYLLKRKRR